MSDKNAVLKCPKCGADNDSQRKLCVHCYAPLHRIQHEQVDRAIQQMVEPYVASALIVAVSLAALTALLNPDTDFLLSLLHSVSVVFLAALAVGLAAYARGLDLSVGGVFALAGLTVALLLDMGLYSALIVTLFLGLVIGGVNGLVIARGRVHPSVVTVCTGSMCVGFVAILSHATPLDTSLSGLRLLANWGPIPASFIIAVVIPALGWWALSRTPFAADFGLRPPPWQADDAAIDTHRHHLRFTILTFALSGLLAALAGVLWVAPTGQMGLPVAIHWLLIPAAAALVGGASIVRQKSSIKGIIAGSIIVALLDRGVFESREYASALVMSSALLLVLLCRDHFAESTWLELLGPLHRLYARTERALQRVFPGRRARRLPSRAVAVCSTVVLLSYCGTVYFVGYRVPAHSAMVVEITGVPQIQRAGKSAWRRARPHGIVHEGDAIRTDTEAKVVMRLHDHSVLVVGEDSKLRLDLVERKKNAGTLTHLKLAAGRVWSRVNNQAIDGRFSVQTSSAVAAVRGTIFGVAVNPSRSLFSVFEGYIDVVAKRSRDLVGPMEEVTVDPTGHSLGRKTISKDELLRFRGVMDELHRTAMADMLDAARDLLAVFLLVLCLLTWTADFAYGALQTYMANRGISEEELALERLSASARLVDALAQGEEFFRQGDYEAAIRQWEAVASVDHVGTFGQQARKRLTDVRRRLEVRRAQERLQRRRQAQTEDDDNDAPTAEDA